MSEKISLDSSDILSLFFLDSICMTLQNDVLLTRLIDFCIIFFQETR